MYYDANQKDGEIGLDFSEAKVGMFVCGNSNVYAYTDRKMTIGLITGTDMDSIRVMIIRNASMPHNVCSVLTIICLIVISYSERRTDIHIESLLSMSTSYSWLRMKIVTQTKNEQ